MLVTSFPWGDCFRIYCFAGRSIIGAANAVITTKRATTVEALSSSFIEITIISSAAVISCLIVVVGTVLIVRKCRQLPSQPQWNVESEDGVHPVYANASNLTAPKGDTYIYSIPSLHEWHGTFYWISYTVFITKLSANQNSLMWTEKLILFIITLAAIFYLVFISCFRKLLYFNSILL